MKYELFIVNRLLKSKKKKKNISKYITKISSFSIALGVVIMIISISTGIGLKKEIRKKITGYSGHLQIVPLDFSSKIISTPISLEQNFHNYYSKINGVKYIQPFATRSGIIKGDEDFEGVLMKGVDSSYNWDFFKNYIIQGSIPIYKKNKRNDSILISKNIANSLQLNLYDNVRMIFFRDNSTPLQRRFIVGGIFHTGMNDFDDNNIISCLWHIQKINNWKKNEVAGFEIILDDFDKISSTAETIYKTIDIDLDVMSVYDKNYSLLAWVELFDTNILAIIFIMIAISGINITTVLLTFILERTKMIGVLKSLGNKSSSIRKIFILISLKMLLKGLFWGNFIAIAIILLQKKIGFIKLNEKVYHTSKAPFDFNILDLVYLNIGTILLCIVMMIIPSYIISKISPAKTMKFD